MSPCQICGKAGAVGNPELCAVLCHECDNAFLAWFRTHGWCIASDYPAWNRGRPGAMADAAQRGRDFARDLHAGATSTCPLNETQRALLERWRQHRKASA